VKYRHILQGEYVWAREHWKQFSAQQVAELLTELPHLANSWYENYDLCLERWEVTTGTPAAGICFDEESGQWLATIWPREEHARFAVCQDAKSWVDSGLTERGWLLL
jgi:hypothetical protein